MRLLSPELERTLGYGPREVRDRVARLPVLDRVDLYATPGCGAMLAWGEQGPALPT